MRRTRFRKSQTEVSLFPFLAVLICTMGGLIVLLVLVVQQARVDARQIAEAKRDRKADDSQAEKLRQEYENQNWRRDVLQQQRVAITEKLSDRRLELGHLEEHLRELQDRWRTLARQLQAAQRRETEEDQSLTALRDQMDSVRQAVAEAEQAVAEAKKKLADAPRSYTIVPYRGPRGTQRRPIYLECTAAGVMIQPAGMLLTAADFNGPLGPGNPLDAALRAIREHWEPSSGDTGEPYPLLLVRPDGVAAYAGAREALQAWDDEFGYELVDARMNLKFPPADPLLRPLLEQTVQTARRRQQALAAAMPSRYDEQPAYGFVATANGGFAPVGGSGRRSNVQPRGGRAVGNGFGGGSAVGTSRRGGSPAAGAGFYPESPASDRQSTGKPGQSEGTRGTDRANGLAGNENSPGQGSSEDSSGRAAAAGPQSARSPAPGSQASSSQMASSQAGSSQAGGSSSGGSPSGGQTGGSAAAGHYQPGRPGNLSGGSVLGGMAASRGSDWALPRSTPGATGVTRPLRIDCYPDRLVIVPDAADKRPPRVVELPESTVAGVDAFVSAVWEEMDHWGIALAGGYWKPVLRMRVAPGAETRYQEVQALLEGSGLTVKRRQP